MSKLTQPELIQIPLSRLLKLEVPRFALRMIELVDRHGPEELKIKELYDLLVAETPRINKLKDKFGPHLLTEELSSLRKMRSLRISEIRFRLKVVIREDKSGEDMNVKILNNELNHFFQNLESSKNEEMFNQKVAQFLDAVKGDTNLSNALNTLGFTDHLQKLQIVHTSIQEIISSKLVSISGRPQETTPELTKWVLRASKNLVKQIEIAPLKNPELDYEPLYSELNQLLSEYKVMINRRVLYNAKKAEAKLGNQSTQTVVTNLIADSAEKMMHLGTEEMDKNGQEVNQVKIEPVKNEKAAATSSKTMQLPLVDNENGALEK